MQPFAIFFMQHWGLFRGLAHDLGKHFHIPGARCGDVLSKFDEVDSVLPGDFLGVECAESQEGLSRHVGRQPMPVSVFADVPEILLFHPNAVDGLDQTPGEQVGQLPNDFVHFLVQQFKVGIGLVLLNESAGCFELLAGLKF